MSRGTSSKRETAKARSQEFLAVAGDIPASPAASVTSSFSPGGGIGGLNVRVNVLSEGLERTQEFIGGATMEAEEMMAGAYERISILHCRVCRLEAACGIVSPPETPRDEDGNEIPRFPETPKDDADASMEHNANESGQGEESPCGGEAEVVQRVEKPRSRPQSGRSRMEVEGNDPQSRGASKCLPNVPKSTSPPPSGDCGRQSPRSPSTEADDDSHPHSAQAGYSTTAGPSDPPSRGSIYENSCGSQSSRCGSRGIGGGGRVRDDGSPPGRSDVNGRSPRSEAMLSHLGAMDLEIRALHERVSQLDVPGAGSVQAPLSREGLQEVLSMVEEVVHQALEEERGQREAATAATVAAVEDAAAAASAAAATATAAANTKGKPTAGGPASSTDALVAEVVREEVGRAISEAETSLRGKIEAAAAELRAECGGREAQEASIRAVALSEASRAEVGKLQVRVDTMVEALEEQRTNTTEFASALRGVERDAQDTCRKLRARLDAAFEETSGRLHGLDSALKAMQTCVEFPTSCGVPPTPGRSRAGSVVGSMVEDGDVLQTIDSRLSVLESELSRGRVRASRSHSSSAAPAKTLPAPLAPLQFAGRGSGAAAEAASYTPRKAAAVEGLAQGLTTLAKVLGLVREEETLGSGDWDWQSGVGPRLEQAWSQRTQELGASYSRASAGSSLNSGATTGASSTGTRRTTLFDVLRTATAGAASPPPSGAAAAAAAAAATTAATRLQDRREAARLQAWLAGAPSRSAASLSATAPADPSAGSRPEGVPPRPESASSAGRRPVSSVQRSASTPGLEKQAPSASPPQPPTSSHRRRV
eukprot:TRINITY_DN28431_c0_g1_i1.p1 TRINITY_DN28431_c0_g1~~TRINITY_DN28431_c0_g1_i1.p1  ORF type:complete len:822 (+),score=167.33 TRINITY_DN28431_c0_g1_i1:107-2572(+)